MAQGFGNPKGPHYGLGRINVAASGTPAPLNQNFSTNEPFAKSGTVPLTANTIIFAASPTNTGVTFVVWKTTGAGIGNLNSIIKPLNPGETWTLTTAFPGNLFSLTAYGIDANNAGDGVYVSAVVI